MFKYLTIFIMLLVIGTNQLLHAQLFSPPFHAANYALKYANALNFDGVNDYVNVTRPVADDFTIEYWVKTTQTGTAGTMWYSGVGIVDAEVGGSTNDFGTSLNGSKLCFGIGSTDYSIISNANINDGSWKHIAVTRTKATGAINIYINGVLDISGTCSNLGSLTAPAYVRIGGMQTAVNYFNGSLDDIRFWNVVRTPAQISANMNQELNGDESGLVAYFKCNQGIPNSTNTSVTTLFDETTSYNTVLSNFTLSATTSNFVFGKLNTGVVTEGLLLYLDPAVKRSYNGSGTTVADISLNVNNGTLSASAPVFNSAPKRFTFNGTVDNYISIPSSKLNTTYTGKTIMVAAKMDANFGTNRFRGLFGNPEDGTKRNFNFYIYNNGSGYQMHFSAAANGSMSDNLPITTGQWIILAATQDASTTRYYLNGTLVGTTAVPLAQYVSSLEEFVGKADNYWLGDIGPVLIYKRWLSETEIVQNYNALKKNLP
jgi:hypothetical protein